MSPFQKEWILHWMCVLSCDSTPPKIGQRRNHGYWERQYRELQQREQESAVLISALHKLQADTLNKARIKYENLLRLTSQTSTTTNHEHTYTGR